MRKIIYYKKDQDLTGAVGVSEIQIGEAVTVLKGGKHFFHAQGIEMVAIYRNACPFCRQLAFY